MKNSKNRNILVFAPNWLGDVIFITPVFRALRKHYPGSSITVAVPERCRRVLSARPDLNEIMIFDERGPDKSWWRKAMFVRKLRRRRFDTVILLHRSFTRALLCFLAGISRRIGYGYKKRPFLLTQSIVPPDKNKIHKQDYYLGVVRAMGVDVPDTACRVYSSKKDSARAENFLASYKGTRIGLSLLTNWHLKNWPLDNYIRVIELIRAREEATFFLTSKASGVIAPAPDAGPDIVNLCGNTSLSFLAALYERMDLVISADSGPLHLAAALGTKYVGLYGATSPFLNSPRSDTKGTIIFHNDFCPLPCFISDCPKNLQCMRSITPDEVAHAALSLLSGGV